jgi:hypothetical protein
MLTFELCSGDGWCLLVWRLDDALLFVARPALC